MYFLKGKYYHIQKIFTEHLYYTRHFKMCCGKEEKSAENIKMNYYNI